MNKWYERGLKREVLKTVGGGGGGGGEGCLMCQKVKHSLQVIRHDSLPFTILLGVLEGRHRLELNAKGMTGLPTQMYIKRMDNLSAST